MNRLSIEACLQTIQQRQPLHAVVDDLLEIKIEAYGFFICTAIHDGHHLRADLAEKCVLSSAERRYEEDPFTAEMIASMPITLVALDSRYEYDLNRWADRCVYQEAWGKTVWQPALSRAQKKHSLEKHAQFYAILLELVKTLEKIHGNCLIYDIHSYNYLRRDSDDTPTFNVGTEQLNTQLWNKVIRHWSKSLAKISLPNITTRAAVDEVFYGRGYLTAFVQQHFFKTLVLPTEVKKIYMDESTGEVFPLVLNALKVGLKEVILANAMYFSKQCKPKTPSIKTKLLSLYIEPAVAHVDEELYKLAKGISTLTYINPKNIVGEKKRFFAKHYNYQPQFDYRQVRINPFEFREKLYRLPVDAIKDASIQQLYRDVIDTFATKIDLLSTINSEKFLYNSLRYYGEPSDDDIRIAKFLLFAKPFEPMPPRNLNAEQAKAQCLQALKMYKIQCKVQITHKIVALAMVAGKTMMINKNIKVNQTEMNALIHHELGVHMVTSSNADLQQLNVFKLGLPGNTYTQEGLAILAEYMTGNISLPRLKTLALRVIAVQMMINRHDFSHTFRSLINDYDMDKEEAFRLTVRVYRGGGFTKDFLYLRGVKDALLFYQRESLNNLYVGKTGFSHLKTINEMVERKMVSKPVHLPVYLQQNLNIHINPIIEYLIKSAY